MKTIFLIGLLCSFIGCGEGEAGNDGGSPDCGSAQVSNDPACPATPQQICAGTMHPCSTPGLTCRYPGQGDGPDQQGCFATSIASCRTPLGVDGGATIWTCAQ